MDYQSIQNLLLKIKKSKPRVLVVGDIMLDHYVLGEVNRISPEAPVPILSFKEEREVLGGAGNVVSNLINLGARVEIATIIGSDSAGKRVKELLSLLEVSSDFICECENENTTKKTRFISNGNQLLRLDVDSTNFSEKDFISLEKRLNGLFDELDCVLVSDYNKGVCSEKIVKNLIKKDQFLSTQKEQTGINTWVPLVLPQIQKRQKLS